MPVIRMKTWKSGKFQRVSVALRIPSTERKLCISTEKDLEKSGPGTSLIPFQINATRFRRRLNLETMGFEWSALPSQRSTGRANFSARFSLKIEGDPQLYRPGNQLQCCRAKARYPGYNVRDSNLHSSIERFFLHIVKKVIRAFHEWLVETKKTR